MDAIPFPEPAETEPQRIAHALRERDVALISRLVEQYQYRLVRYLLYLTVRRECVEDLVQETWVRVLDRAALYDGRSRFEPWLFSIARNLAIDDLRRVLPQGLTLHTGPEDTVRCGLQPSEQASPYLLAAKAEDSERLAAALEMLEPIYRECLLLRFQEELSLREISTVVGAPVPTVSSRVYRGLALLRSFWEGGANAV